MKREDESSQTFKLRQFLWKKKPTKTTLCGLYDKQYENFKVKGPKKHKMPEKFTVD